MRAGICSIQQALTVEAVAIVKQALSLARRRGHAQVTPLHVASSMLASSTGLLRRACLQSHSHPLQCKALELCFNVALNRLPASTPSPLLGPAHSPHPSLSNALVAAFKRAQAHQRRGSIENQQQPILALKIEIEQLVISILDDPSVSRVMREAGFSSTHVKSRVEQAVSVEACSQQVSRPDSSANNLPNKEITVTAAKPLSVVHFAPSALEHASSEDVESVIDTLLSKKRNVVIVGEGLSGPEGVVRGVLDKFERGLVPLELRSFQLISFPLFSLGNLLREELEQKISELRNLVKSCTGRGIVLYLGDLQGVSEFWSSYVGQTRGYYCWSSLECLILELKRLVCGSGESNKRIWLMGTATIRTYMKCKAGHPSLEAIWDLHPLTVPAGSLSLSLNLDSSLQADSKSKVLIDVENSLACCKDWTLNFEKNDQAFDSFKMKDSTSGTSASSTLPSWLQQYKNEKSRDSLNLHHKQEDCVSVKNLSKKWHSFGGSAHEDSHGRTLKFSSIPSSPTTSFSSPERNPSFLQSNLSWPTMIEFKQSPKEHQFWASDGLMIDPPKPDLLSNPNSSPNSASSSEVAEDMNDNSPSFKDYSSENIKTLYDALAAKVPWQREIIPDIVETILLCRSGKSSESEGPGERVQGEKTLMLFLGADSNAKENIARELAKLVFGSLSKFISISLSRFSDSVQEHGKKRPREDSGYSYLQRFGEAVNESPHRVFFLEDVDQFDYSSKLGIKRAMESGKVSVSGGEMVSLKDAIVILSCESLSTVSRREKNASQQQEKERGEKENNSEEEKCNGVSLDLNMAIGDEDEKEEDGIDQMILDRVDRKIIFKLVQEQ